MDTVQPPPSRSHVREALDLALNLGFTIAVPLVGFALLGRWLDRRLDTSPWLFLGGAMLAIATSTTILITRFKRILSKP